MVKAISVIVVAGLFVQIFGGFTNRAFGETVNLMNTSVQVYTNSPRTFPFTVPYGSSGYFYGNIGVTCGIFCLLTPTVNVRIVDQSNGYTIFNQEVRDPGTLGMTVIPGHSYFIGFANTDDFASNYRMVNVLLNIDVTSIGNLTAAGNMTR